MKLILALAFAAFAFSSYADVSYRPLIKCTPTDGSLFRFLLSEVKGCSGAQCDDVVDMKLYGISPVTHRWTLAGFAGQFPNTALADKPNETFGFHFAKTDGSEYIDVDKSGNDTVVNIKLNISFPLVPKVDTGGEQKMFTCVMY